MLKRLSAIFALYLACSVMLAFAVLPHHHHKQFICFESNHCHSQADDHHSHDDNPFGHSKGCIKQLLQTQVSRSQTLSHSCADGHCHHFIVPLFLAADILQLLSNQTSNEDVPDTFYREKLHAVFTAACLAGRAPPVQG